MEILCTLSFLAVMVLLVAVFGMAVHLRAERKRRLEADEALFKMLSGISDQFSSLIGALAEAGVVVQANKVVKGISLEKRANLDPDVLARVDAIAATLGMTREEALLYIAREGIEVHRRQGAGDEQKEVHCKGPLCGGDPACTCTCPACNRARRSN